MSKEKGLVYAGYFEDGKRSGVGVSFQPEDRSLFIGQWRNGVQQLKGTLVDQDGTLLYSGALPTANEAAPALNTIRTARFAIPENGRKTPGTERASGTVRTAT